VVLCAEQQVSYIGANKQLSGGGLVSSAKLYQRPRSCLPILVQYLRSGNDISCCTCCFLCGGIGFTVLPVGSFSFFFLEKISGVIIFIERHWATGVDGWMDL
jgi:hypothetical protein